MKFFSNLKIILLHLFITPLEFLLRLMYLSIPVGIFIYILHMMDTPDKPQDKEVTINSTSISITPNAFITLTDGNLLQNNFNKWERGIKRFIRRKKELALFLVIILLLLIALLLSLILLFGL